MKVLFSESIPNEYYLMRIGDFTADVASDSTEDFAADSTADFPMELRRFSNGRPDFTINLEK